MPIFQFYGRDITGKALSGERLAQSIDHVSTQLLKEGITPIRIHLIKKRADAWETIKDFLGGGRVTAEELSLFSRQMYTLCKTGVPITIAFRQLADSTSSSRMARALHEIVEDLESGQDLVSAMQIQKHVFSPLMISMIRVGQATGQFEQAFLHLNKYIDLETTALKQTKTAFRYPTLVFGTLVAAIIVINIFIIPTFANVYSQANISLPIITIGLIAFSRFITQHSIILIMGISALVAGITYYLHTPTGKIAWHKSQLKLPIIGPILKRIILLRFSQTFSITIESGISLIEGLTLVAQAMNNKYAFQEIMLMQDAIQRGNTITQAAQHSELFSSLELQMFFVSEETGDLGPMLEQLATFYQHEVSYDIKKLNDFIEPLLILVLSIVILILAFAVYLPIWNMVRIAHV